jgi:hypothetical protein
MVRQAVVLVLLATVLLLHLELLVAQAVLAVVLVVAHQTVALVAQAAQEYFTFSIKMELL